MDHHALNLELRSIPFCRTYGLKIEAIGNNAKGDDDWVLRLPYHARIGGNPKLKAIHGGFVAATLELAAAIGSVVDAEGSVKIPKAFTATTAYLRPTGPHDLLARANISKRGRQIIVCHASAWQLDQNRPVATALVHFQSVQQIRSQT